MDSRKVSWQGMGFPNWLILSQDDTLSGKPIEESKGENFTIKATYKGHNGQQVYTVVVNGVTLEVTQISGGASHTCAVTTSGAALCWGDNYAGQLGDGTKANRLVPTQVTPGAH